MASNGTALAAAGGVDLDDWTFKNLPAVILYYTGNIPFFVATALGVILITGAVLAFFFLLIVAIIAVVSHLLDLRSKSKKAPQDAGESAGITLQDRLGGDEGSAEQPLLGKAGEAGANGDVDEGPELMSEFEQLPRYDGLYLLARSKAMNRHSYAVESRV